jgi:hypothetical protein
VKRHLEVLDSLAHFLHRIHLIPDWLLRQVCDPYDRSIWAGFGAAGDVIPPEAQRICGWTCPHFTMTASLCGILTAPPSTSLCDCEMQPVYADRGSR